MVFTPDTRRYTELYFLRHGPAGQHGDPKYKDDSLRPLTSQGKKKMRRVAQGMKNLELQFDAFLSSPYLRARQTAEIVAQAYQLKSKKIRLTKSLLPPASVKILIKEIRQKFPKAKKILCVGHEPHLTDMISELLGSPKALNIDFKKGGLCFLTLHEAYNPKSAVLNWLIGPEQIVKMKR